ncbi:MAG: hypothetical protein V1872_11700 [bacterium]
MANKRYFVVDEQTWKRIPANEQVWMIYKNQVETNSRLDRLERTNFIKSLSAFIGGIVGGSLASLGVKKF